MPLQTKDQLLRDLGRRIKAIRNKTGMTQEACAGTSEIDVKRWQRIEQGQANITIATLNRVAKALDLDLWQLMRVLSKKRS